MKPEAKRPKSPFLQSFSRSQIASAVATAADYGVIFFLTELLHVWYVISVALGALAGGITNFLMNRYWSFQESAGDRWHSQAVRYSVTSGMSLVLNTGGVYLMTEYLRIHYAISVVVVSILVGLLFNFPMQRHYVFR